MAGQEGKDKDKGNAASSPEDRSRDVAGRQDPIVERRRPQPGEPAVAGRTLRGFLGDSDRRGNRRLYFTKSLDYYAEFAVEDVLHTVAIPPDRLPFPGEEATEVTLKKDVLIAYTRDRESRPPDVFDLDYRRLPRMRPRTAQRNFADTEVLADCGYATYEVRTCSTCEVTCMGSTCEDTCKGGYSCEWYSCEDEHCTQATCNDTGCTGCCPFPSLDTQCGPSQIETACVVCQ